MQRHVAFLHTSPAHVETFTRLAGAAAPDVKVDHVVEEDLLAQAQRVGAAEPALVERVHAAMVSAAQGGAALVVCTCSTIGGVAERTPTGGRFVAMRIDRAMADRAVQLGPRVLVVATVESTLEPTAQLIRESAAAMAAQVELKPLLVEGAWAHFLRQDHAAYAEAVARAVRGAAGTCDVVVLAQASMAAAAPMLADLDVEVLSSPELGVQSALAQLN